MYIVVWRLPDGRFVRYRTRSSRKADSMRKLMWNVDPSVCVFYRPQGAKPIMGVRA